MKTDGLLPTLGLPMGDNRDNSRDGRNFGPVAEKKS
jgi:hypothetical protein